MKAIFNNTVVAESDNTIVVEGNHYFPKESLKMDFFTDSVTQSICPWKGMASYYNVEVAGKVLEDAGWYYSNPSLLAKNIKGHVAFWKGVEVIK